MRLCHSFDAVASGSLAMDDIESALDEFARTFEEPPSKRVKPTEPPPSSIGPSRPPTLAATAAAEPRVLAPIEPVRAVVAAADPGPDAAIGPARPAHLPAAPDYGLGTGVVNHRTAKKPQVRAIGGHVWVDESLEDWPENDFRLFVGDLGPEVDDVVLASFFSRYPSFAKAKVVREKESGKGKGFGFVSYLDPTDAAKAIRDLNRQHLRSRPITVKWSSWHKRSLSGMSKQERKEQMELVRIARGADQSRRGKRHR
jgi:hypothetical protein